MSKAGKKLQDLIDSKLSKVIDAIGYARIGAYSEDETHGQLDLVSTFIFTYEDESQLRIDTSGSIYTEQNYEDAFNIFNR